jgi:hypothetical protein
MADERVLQVVLKARDEASKTLKAFATQAEKTGDTIKDKLEKNAVGFGAAFAATTGIIVSSIGAYSETQASLEQLNAVLESTGQEAGVTYEQVLQLGSSYQQLSLFSDDAIVNAQSLLLTFTSIGKDVFPQAVKTILDMSQALGQDLKSSTIQLGKALNDPINGITALSRVGVSFTEQQKEQIKTLQESGNIMGAQQIILKELGKEFGGSAYAATQTFGGQIEILKNNIGDLQETIGQGLIDTLTNMTGGFNGANSAIINLNTFLSTHKDVLNGLIIVLGGLALTFGALVVAATVAMAGVAAAVVGAVGLAIGGILFFVSTVAYHWEGLKFLGKGIWGEIARDFQDMGLWMQRTANDIYRFFRNTFDAFPGIVQAALREIGKMIASFNPIIRIGLDLPDIVGAWNSLREKGKKNGIPGFANGGWVNQTGLALVHQGEFVLSRDMIAGRTPAPITNNSSNSSIHIDKLVVQDQSDINGIAQRLAFYLQTDGSI